EAYDAYAQRIGKVAAALTDAEKKQAFMTIALEKAEEAASRANVSLDTNASRMIRVQSAWENFKDSFTTGVADVVGGYLQWTDAQDAAAESARRAWELQQAGATGYIR